ncbi:MAG: flagellar M-ring protein FliF C-terminal domain-containing protein [Oscillospiraceae bacterium]
MIVAGGVLALAVLLTVFLNAGKMGYALLYTEMDAAESAEVYAALQNLEVPVAARMNGNGEVEVPVKDKDKALIEMALQGIPRTGLPYDIDNGSGGLTSTDADKRRAYTQQLQNRLQDTLRGFEGIKNAVVTLNISQQTNRVWETQSAKSTGSVTLYLEKGAQLGPKEVSGIKHLTASSVGETMRIEDVKVIDAATSLNLKGSEDIELNPDGVAGEIERLNLTATVEQQLVAKADNILTMYLTPENYRISATVKLDYNKMISESKEYMPSPDANNNAGVLESEQKDFVMNPSNFAQGLPGEEQNTDTPPGYESIDNNGDGVPDYVDSHINSNYVVSYITKQIEKNQAELLESSMAVAIKGDIDEDVRDSIKVSISKATNIPEENISVENLAVQIPETVPSGGKNILEGTQLWIMLGALGGILLLLLVVMMMILGAKKKKKKKLAAADGEGLTSAMSADAAMLGVNSQQELDIRKKQIQDAALRSKNENAIAEEVRDFAKANPQITANLLRNWIKEDDE